MAARAPSMRPMLPSKSSLIRRKTLSLAAARTTQGTLRRSANTTRLLWKTRVDAVSLMKVISPTTSPLHQMPYRNPETLYLARNRSDSLVGRIPVGQWALHLMDMDLRMGAFLDSLILTPQQVRWDSHMNLAHNPWLLTPPIIRAFPDNLESLHTIQVYLEGQEDHPTAASQATHRIILRIPLDQAVSLADPPMRRIQLGARTPQMTPTYSKSDKSCMGNLLGSKGMSTTLLRPH